MNDCKEILGRLTLYLDNELQGDELTLVESHLRSCTGCRLLIERERLFLSEVRSAGPIYNAPDELRARVTEILAESPVPGNMSVPGSNRSVFLAIAAGLLVVLIPLAVWQAFSQQSAMPVATINRPSNFALMAAETHLRRIRGQLPLEMVSDNPQQVSQWFDNKVNFSVKLPNYQESSGQEKLYTLEGARLTGYKDDYAAYVAYKMQSRPISLVITSDAVATPSGGEEIASRGLKFHYDAIQGFKVITWSDRGLAYALVSDLDERGQQSCIVCHQGTKDQDFIEPLKPR